MEAPSNGNAEYLYVSKIVITITTPEEFVTPITFKSDAVSGIMLYIPGGDLKSYTIDFGFPGYRLGERSTGSTKRALIVAASGNTSQAHAGFTTSVICHEMKKGG